MDSRLGLDQAGAVGLGDAVEQRQRLVDVAALDEQLGERHDRVLVGRVGLQREPQRRLVTRLDERPQLILGLGGQQPRDELTHLVLALGAHERVDGLAAGERHDHRDRLDAKLGGNPFSGFTTFLSNPYLLAIGLFILLYVVMNTFIYFELRKLLGDFDRDVRTQIWGGIDLAVNSIAFFVALFATGRLATRFGMPTTLALIPALMVGGWAIVALSPVLAVLIGLQVARRAGNYAITRPGREMLFTAVDADTRFKAKPVIDIVVYRGGDMLTAWFYTALTSLLGFGLAGVAVVSAVIAAIWAGAGVFLGRKYDRGGHDPGDDGNA